MPEKSFTVTRGGVTSTISVNRDIDAGVTTFTRNPLDKTTTRVYVTVAGHADMSGVYSASAIAHATWHQEGGRGQIAAYDYSPADQGNYSHWLLVDDSDADPYFEFFGTFAQDRPWESSNTGMATFSTISEPISVDRTASVVTSDRAGESRPLLSKVVGGAAVAYSLRDLNDKQGNNKVVRVRRESDNQERDFLAKEVSNGTLEDWVNTNVVSNGVFTNIGFESFSNASSSGFTASNTGSTGFAASPISGSNGTVISVSFDINITNGSPKLMLRTNLDPANSSPASNSLEYTSSGSKTATLTAYTNFVALYFTEGDVPSNFTVSNFKILGDDGFVETWYDQSGNGRDSTQATVARQPIIVESGTFQDGLKFTHTDTTNGKRMYVPRSTSELGTEFALVWVGKLTANSGFTKVLFGGVRGVQGNNSGSVGLMGRVDTSSTTATFRNEKTSSSSQSESQSNTLTLNEDSVMFANYDDDAVVFSVDGNVTTDTFSSTVLTSTADLRIMAGQSASGATGGFYRTQESATGICKEILVYDTNQSANRPAIEANIKNQYNLT